ncbi:Diacylglycerol kinase [Candidatus Nitrotoga sp. HW29]|uniref:diacylglycerol kinase n=1 Tax=Candidatus Nitrotoga sp. HW29 TaxID=2886963 RepID=UPI001EF1944C|nr:diacylglycerol kinase [Candidatus Nitrotoga sp. HW29]CAH1903788.1 Diacylglycerol kinase [Candidatus Nitrotoga sp. HW29]
MTNANPHKTSGLRRLVNALRYSLSGLFLAWRDESAFRQEAIFAIVLVPVAFMVPVDVTQRVLLVASVMLVLMVEMINSSIEAVVDRISLDIHPLAKKAKDMGSAAVLLALMNAILIWAMILWPLR